jgi:hypothetical protein
MESDPTSPLFTILKYEGVVASNATVYSILEVPAILKSAPQLLERLNKALEEEKEFEDDTDQKLVSVLFEIAESYLDLMTATSVLSEDENRRMYVLCLLALAAANLKAASACKQISATRSGDYKTTAFECLENISSIHM